MEELDDEIQQLEKEKEMLEMRQNKLMKLKTSLEAEVFAPTSITFKEFEERSGPKKKPNINLLAATRIDLQNKIDLYHLCGICYTHRSKNKAKIKFNFAAGSTLFSGYEMEIRHVEGDYKFGACNMPIGLDVRLVKEEIPINSQNDVKIFLKFLHICGCAFFNREKQEKDLTDYINEKELPVVVFSSINKRYIEILLQSPTWLKLSNDEDITFILVYDIDSCLPEEVTYKKENILKGDEDCLDQVVQYFLSETLLRALTLCMMGNVQIKQLSESKTKSTTEENSKSKSDTTIENHNKNPVMEKTKSKRQMLEVVDQYMANKNSKRSKNESATEENSKSKSDNIIENHKENPVIEKTSKRQVLEVVDKNSKRSKNESATEENSKSKSDNIENHRGNPVAEKTKSRRQVLEGVDQYMANKSSKGSKNEENITKNAEVVKKLSKGVLNPISSTPLPKSKYQQDKDDGTSSHELNDISSIVSSDLNIQNVSNKKLTVNPQAASTPFHPRRSPRLVDPKTLERHQKIADVPQGLENSSSKQLKQTKIQQVLGKYKKTQIPVIKSTQASKKDITSEKSITRLSTSKSNKSPDLRETGEARSVNRQVREDNPSDQPERNEKSIGNKRKFPVHKDTPVHRRLPKAYKK